MTDWTYSEGCGCRVTFLGESGYSTSRMIPGAGCELHVRPGQMHARDELLSRARDAFNEARLCHCMAAPSSN